MKMETPKENLCCARRVVGFSTSEAVPLRCCRWNGVAFSGRLEAAAENCRPQSQGVRQSREKISIEPLSRVITGWSLGASERDAP